MSGGSFDYLYCKEPEAFLEGATIENLDRMIARVVESGGPMDFAKALERFKVYLQLTRLRIETQLEFLSSTMQEVEWCASGDGGDPEKTWNATLNKTKEIRP